MHLNYGNSDYDVRHTISANYLWSEPFKFSNKVVNAVAGGWQLSGTFFFRTGLPFSIIDGLMPNFIGNAQGPNTSGVVLAQPLGTVATECGTSAINKPCMQLSQFVGAGSGTAFSTQNKNSYRGPGYFNTGFLDVENLHANGTPAVFVQLGSIISTVVSPTSPHGAFVGSAVSGREIQVTGRITF
jgi:hypothetical protein